jgi:8-oxo-(d)GTP phosphatase
MTPEAETPFVPNDETDELRWLSRDEAMSLLTYDRDRDVLAAAL